MLEWKGNTDKLQLTPKVIQSVDIRLQVLLDYPLTEVFMRQRQYGGACGKTPYEDHSSFPPICFVTSGSPLLTLNVISHTRAFHCLDLYSLSCFKPSAYSLDRRDHMAGHIHSDWQAGVSVMSSPLVNWWKHTCPGITEGYTLRWRRALFSPQVCHVCVRWPLDSPYGLHLCLIWYQY